MSGGNYTNADGLSRHYGTRTAQNKGQNINKGGNLQEIRMHIVGTEVPLTTASDEHIVGGGVIPSGAYIVSSDLYVSTAFTSGGSATLDLGTFNPDTQAAVDINGLDAVIAVAALTDDTVIAGNGAQIDTVIAEDVVVGHSYNVAAFTAGVATLVVRYFVPSA